MLVERFARKSVNQTEFQLAVILRKPRPTLHLILAVTLAFPLLAISVSVSNTGASEHTSRAFQGVTLTTRSVTVPRKVTEHIVQIDLTAPGLSFKLTPHLGSADTIRQTTLDFLNQEKAQLGVNVHFFTPFPSQEVNVNVVGLAVSEGRMYSAFEPQPVAAGLPDQSYAIVPFAPALNIDQSNHVMIVHRDPAYADNQHTLENVALWNAFSGSAQIVSNGVKTIPDFGPGGLKASRHYDVSHSWYSERRARTAIGVTADRKTLVLFVVDNAGGSQGMTVDEVADVLIRDFQVADALNLDGGGSSTLVMEDPASHTGRVVNVSSDNPRGRAVGSNLAIFARPNSNAAAVSKN
jgi:hypothetical protein